MNELAKKALKKIRRGRVKGMKDVLNFINTADIYEIAEIMYEIVNRDKNIFVFNHNIRSLDLVDQVGINGECIQLNLEVNTESEQTKI